MVEEVYQFGDFRFVPRARELWRAQRRVTLPRRSFECLEYLLAHRDRAVHRDELVRAVFGRADVSDAQIGQVVLRTRRALDDDGNAQRTIRTIAGFGYRWVAETEQVAGVDDPAGHTNTVADAEVLPSLEADVAGDDAADRLRRWRASRRRALLAALAVAAAVLMSIALGLAWLWHRTAAPEATSPAAQAMRVAVLPLRVEGLHEDAWVRLGAMDLIADRLRTAGLAVPPSETVLNALQATKDPAGAIDPAHVRVALAAPLIVQGRAIRGATGWSVELAAQPERGVATPVTFSAPDAVQAARGAADLLLAALGRTPPPERERDGALDEVLQRARAAMLANELGTARAILSASPQLAADPDQLGYWLALVDFRAGRLDDVEAALDALLGKATAQADPHFRARLLNARGETRLRRGAVADGAKDYDAALAALAADGDALDRGKAHMGRANSLVAMQRFSEALGEFAAARVDLESAGDVLGVARVDGNLGMLELYRGRPAAALGYLPGAADRLQALGALRELLHTLPGLVEAQEAMLQREAAWATVERASSLRERIIDPDQRVDLLLVRTQVLLGAGRYREAQAALDQAGSIATSGNGLLRERRYSAQADLAARLGRWDQAEAATATALANWPVSGAETTRAGVVWLRQRALLALGREVEAAALLDRTRAAPDEASDRPGVVADALAMAEWAAHQRQDVRAAAWFHFATATAERQGVPVEMATAAKAYGPWLLARGALEEATTVIGRVATWAGQDFDCALLQLRLHHALGQREAWLNALRQAQTLAGEREIPPELMRFPGN